MDANDPKLSTTHPAMRAFWAALVTEFADREMPFELALLEATRSPARQSRLVETGASRTMQSLHLLQADGFSRAIDIGADVDLGDRREVRWDWPLYHQIADVARDVSRRIEVPIVWGGVWDARLGDLRGDIEAEVALYVERFRAARSHVAAIGARPRGPLVDGPHYQLAQSVLPASRWWPVVQGGVAA